MSTEPAAPPPAVQGAPDLTELRELAWRLRRVHDRTDHAADRKLCAGVAEQAASAIEAAADRMAVQGAPGGHERIAGASVYCSCGNGWPCAEAIAPGGES